MTILHLVRSFGKKRLGGAERNIYNLVHLISLKSHETNLVICDDGIWKYYSKSNDFKKINSKIKYEYCYVGSLFKGKGLEIIYGLASRFKKKKIPCFW